MSEPCVHCDRADCPTLTLTLVDWEVREGRLWDKERHLALDAHLAANRASTSDCIAHLVRWRDRALAAEEALTAAYAEFRKLLPFSRVVFDRDVWTAAKEAAPNRPRG